MKECDQDNGEDMNPDKTDEYKASKPDAKVEMVDTGAIDYKGETIKIPKA